MTIAQINHQAQHEARKRERRVKAQTKRKVEHLAKELYDNMLRLAAMAA